MTNIHIVIVLICIAGIIIPQEADDAELIQQIQELGDSTTRAFTSADERYAAIRKLGKINHPESIKILEELLIFRWEQQGDSRSNRSIRKQERKLRQARESMNRVRAKAAEALGVLGAEQSVPLMVKVIREEDDSVVREYTLKALLKFYDLSLAAVYRDVALNDPTAGNRLIGVFGLSQYPQRIREETMQAILADENIIVRLTAIKLLGASGRKEFYQYIVAAGYDIEPQIKRKTAEMLGYINTLSGVDVLMLLARDNDKGVVYAAAAGLAVNQYVPPTELLNLLRSIDGPAAHIIIKASYTKWAHVRIEQYTQLENDLPPSVHNELKFVRKKVICRKNLHSAQKTAEKINLFLTDWRQRGKL